MSNKMAKLGINQWREKHVAELKAEHGEGARGGSRHTPHPVPLLPSLPRLPLEDSAVHLWPVPAPLCPCPTGGRRPDPGVGALRSPAQTLATAVQ